MAFDNWFVNPKRWKRMKETKKLVDVLSHSKKHYKEWEKKQSEWPEIFFSLHIEKDQKRHLNF